MVLFPRLAALDRGRMTSALVIIRDLSRLRKLEYEVTGKYMFENMIGKSPAMRQVFTLIENLADADTTVLIQGPERNGEGAVAGALHYHGKGGRRNSSGSIVRRFPKRSWRANSSAMRGASRAPRTIKSPV